MVERHILTAAMRKRDGLAVALFLAAASFWTISLWATLVLPKAWALVASLANALAIAQLFLIGHDACHQSFTSRKWLNGLIGRLVFLPSIHLFSLWEIGHNRLHHGYNNIRGLDYVWAPKSPADYAGMGRLARAFYRFERSRVGVFAYYAYGIWASKMIWPRRDIVGKLGWRHIGDALLVWSFVVALAGGLAWYGAVSGRGVAFTLLASFIIPFIVWNMQISFAIYLQHIHPQSHWFESLAEWRLGNGQIKGTVLMSLGFLDRVYLNIFEHQAHHYAPGVPLYNLPVLQRALGRDVGLGWTFNWAEFARIVRACKLYDYDRKMWLGFPVVARV